MVNRKRFLLHSKIKNNIQLYFLVKNFMKRLTSYEKVSYFDSRKLGIYILSLDFLFEERFFEDNIFLLFDKKGKIYWTSIDCL